MVGAGRGVSPESQKILMKLLLPLCEWVLACLCLLWYNMFLCLFSLSPDDIMQRENGLLCAAEIGSELQKQFAFLPGWSWFDIFPH